MSYPFSALPQVELRDLDRGAAEDLASDCPKMHLPSALPQCEAGDTSIDQSLQTWNYVCQSLCIFVMSVSFGLSLYTRLFIHNGFGKEDCACSIAWLLGVCYSVIALIMGHYGGGLHYSDIPIEHRAPLKKTLYVAMVTYGPTVYLTRTCLLMIITRVFSPVRKAVLFIYVFRGIMLAYYISAVIVKIRICSPIAKFWDTDIDGTCLDKTSIILADAVVSVVSDLILLILPLPLAMGLQMSTKKIMTIMAILGAGGFAVVASIVRLARIVSTGQTKDVTLAFMRINMLGNAEVSIGVICTSLPSLSALATRIYHEYSSNKATNTSEYRMNSIKNQNKTSRSRMQVSMWGAEPDLDVLTYNAQGNPGIETTITHPEGVSGSLSFDEAGITRTVDVSTSVETR